MDAHHRMPRASTLPLEDQIRLLSGQDFWHTRALPEHGIPALTLTDGPHGIRLQEGDQSKPLLSRSVPATCFPTAVTLGATWDPALCREIGAALGAEARALGVDVVLGPGLNLKRSPLGGRNFEYLSEDPLLSGVLAAALVQGIQSAGVGACPKHFAVNNQEFARFTVDARVDERTLRELYLSAFERVVTTADPWTVMAAYNSLGGTTLTEHEELLTAVLREEWGFGGLVVSDWGATGDRVRSLEAGMDLEMPGTGGVNDGEVREAVRAERLDFERVEESAQRLLDLIARVSREPSSPAPSSPDAADPGAAAAPSLPEPLAREHHELARRAAASGTVLLTNDGTLPFTRDTRVALIGAFAEEPRFQGSGSSLVAPTRLVTLRESLAARGVPHTFVRGDGPAGLADAARAASEQDVAVVCVGLPPSHESEGFDRSTLALPPEHDALVEAVATANPRTIVVVMNGAPVLLPWAARAAAVVEAHLGGQAGGAALADVLLGLAEPGGRLAESFPAAVEDQAVAPWFPGSARLVEHREGLMVGYRHHTSAGVAPAFAFGHGLSYTTFAYADAAVSASAVTAGSGVTVAVTVTNTGSRAGSEVVQVYRHDRSGVVERPRRELVGFVKVWLEAGASTRVEVPVEGRAFAFWDVRVHDWRVPSGPVDLEVGRSSEAIEAVLSLRVVDGVTSGPGPVEWVDPEPFAVRPFTRDSTLAEVATHPLGRQIKELLMRTSPVVAEARQDPAVALMVGDSFDLMPLRALVLHSGGRVPWALVDSLLDILNGKPGSLLARAGSGLAGVAGAAGQAVSQVASQVGSRVASQVGSRVGSRVGDVAGAAARSAREARERVRREREKPPTE